MRKNVYIVATLVVAAVSMVGLTQTRPVGAEKKDTNQHIEVEICHSRQPQPSNGQGGGAQGNPYGPGKITTDDDSILKESGHSSHDGPVFNNTGQDYWGDIIPPFTATDGTQYQGLNWTTEGQAIYNNNCQPIVVVPAPDLEWDIVCDLQAKEAVITFENSGDADGTVVLNGASIVVMPNTPEVRRLATGENGVQVTITINGQVAYDKVVTCVPGRGGAPVETTPSAPVQQSTTSTPTKILPYTSGGSAGIIAISSAVLAALGVVASSIRRLVIAKYL